MKRTALPAIVLAILVATPGLAQDPRLVELAYDANTVFVIEGRTKVQATVRFGEDETIENVAIGDSRAWQVTPNKRANLLFIKPLAQRARTNMTVVTDKRTYLFDLVASPSADPIYVMSFTYPQEPAQTAVAPETASPVELAAATDPYAVVDPVALNFAWEKSGDRALLPARIFNDADATYLAWPSDRPMPAILIVNSEGVEGPVNFTVRGETIVIPQVPGRIILRAGEDHAELTYAGPPEPVVAASESAALAAASDGD